MTKKAKKTLIIISIVLAVILGLNMLLVLYERSTAEKFIKRYHGFEIYSQQRYLDKEEFGEKVYHTGVNAKYFLPEYEEIEYNYSDINFCIFDGTATLTQTAVSFALDLRFSGEDEYELAKQNELSTCNFMTKYEGKRWHEKDPVFEFEIGNFICKTVSSDNYPCRFGLLCFNDNDSTLRYLYFEEWESPEYIKNAKYIQSCTECIWD